MGCGANFKDGPQIEALKKTFHSSDTKHPNYLLMIPVCSGDLGHESVANPGARTERYEIRTQPINDVPGDDNSWS